MCATMHMFLCKLFNNRRAAIKIEDIVLDKRIYPRIGIDHKRVFMFEENMRDGFKFDPIHLQAHPDELGKYRILDGAHRYKAYKGIGAKEVKAEIINLNGEDPLLYAASQAIGPRELKDEDARYTARRAYQNNPNLSSEKIGRVVGRTRRSVDSYISDLRAAVKANHSLKIFRMARLGVPQERISKRLNVLQSGISSYLSEKATLPNPINSEIEKGFTVTQIAEKHGWPEFLVWSLKLDGKNDLNKYQELQWGLRSWDDWKWTDCLPREIHVNDSRADFTGAIRGSVTNGQEGYLPSS